MIRRNGIDGSGSDGVAYGWLFLLIFVFAGAITIIVMFQLENTLFTEIINPFIVSGSMSEQTANAISFQRSIGMGLPIIVLVGAMLWAFMRGVAGRDGLVVSSGVFYQAWIILISLCLLGFLMSFLGGTIIDRFYTSLDNANMIQGTMVSAEWNTVQDGTMWTFVNGFYTLCYLCPIIGLIIFIKSVVVRTYGDRYSMGGY